jgi:mannose-6-phosphate isomerase-like protein (cupin superfamily)
MEYFDIVHLNPGDTHCFERMGAKEKLIVGGGKCRLSFEGQSVVGEKNQVFDLTTPDGAFCAEEVFEPTVLVRMAGHWGEDIGGAGLFPVWNTDNTANWGDKHDYPKSTPFDRHYHDSDEYWILIQGSGTAVSEEKFYEVGPGDCVVTGMGHYHDFPSVKEPVIAVAFETTLMGRKRRGHLWEHANGPAEPQMDRV